MTKLREMYQNKPVKFALLWIVFYCIVMTAMDGSKNVDRPFNAAALIFVSVIIFAFVKASHLEKEIGLDAWPVDSRKYLYFLPLWVLTTGNLWAGVSLNYKGMGQVYAIISMMLVGFVEEMIFRGFLFRGLLRTNKETTAIIISAVTFGIGHITNLLIGQEIGETLIQIVYAVALGFVFTLVYYKSGKLWPCIIAHSLIDIFSTINAENDLIGMVYVCIAIIVSVIYSVYLWKLPGNGFEEEINEQQ